MDFPPDALLAKITKPPKYCQNCSQREEETEVELKRCTGCKSVFYCDTSCQRTDWVTGHKDRCKTSDSFYTKERKLAKKTLKCLFDEGKQLLSAKLDWVALLRLGSVCKRAGKLTGRSTVDGQILFVRALHFLRQIRLACLSDSQTQVVYQKLGRIHWLIDNREEAIAYFMKSLGTSSKSCGPVVFRTLFRIYRGSCPTTKLTILKKICVLIQRCKNKEDKTRFFRKLYLHQITLLESLDRIDEVYDKFDEISDRLDQQLYFNDEDFYKVGWKLLMYQDQPEEALPLAEKHLQNLIRKHKRSSQIQARKDIQQILKYMGRHNDAAKHDVHIFTLTEEFKRDRKEEAEAAAEAEEKEKQAAAAAAVAAEAAAKEVSQETQSPQNKKKKKKK